MENYYLKMQNAYKIMFGKSSEKSDFDSISEGSDRAIKYALKYGLNSSEIPPESRKKRSFLLLGIALCFWAVFSILGLNTDTRLETYCFIVIDFICLFHLFLQFISPQIKKRDLLIFGVCSSLITVLLLIIHQATLTLIPQEKMLLRLLISLIPLYHLTQIFQVFSAKFKNITDMIFYTLPFIFLISQVPQTHLWLKVILFIMIIYLARISVWHKIKRVPFEEDKVRKNKTILRYLWCTAISVSVFLFIILCLMSKTDEIWLYVLIQLSVLVNSRYLTRGKFKLGFITTMIIFYIILVQAYGYYELQNNPNHSFAVLLFLITFRIINDLAFSKASGTDFQHETKKNILLMLPIGLVVLESFELGFTYLCFLIPFYYCILRSPQKPKIAENSWQARVYPALDCVVLVIYMATFSTFTMLEYLGLMIYQSLILSLRSEIKSNLYRSLFTIGAFLLICSEIRMYSYLIFIPIIAVILYPKRLKPE